MGRMSDYTIRPKPNSWPSSPNEYRQNRTSAHLKLLSVTNRREIACDNIDYWLAKIMLLLLWYVTADLQGRLVSLFYSPYILTYKSPPKNRVRIWSKIIDLHISRRWLLRTCTGCKLQLIISSTKACYSDVRTDRRLQRRRDGWPTSRQASHRVVGQMAVASTWPLMHNWDHPINQ